MSNIIRALWFIGVTLCAVQAQQTNPTPPTFQSTQTFGMVGIAQGQTARLNVLNLGIPAPLATAAMCSATLTFFDDTGATLKTETMTLVPQKSVAFDLDSVLDLKLGVSDRKEIRAIIQVLLAGVPAPNPVSGGGVLPLPIAFPGACNLVPTLEIFDTMTHRTQTLLEKTTSQSGLISLFGGIISR